MNDKELTEEDIVSMRNRWNELSFSCFSGCKEDRLCSACQSQDAIEKRATDAGWNLFTGKKIGIKIGLGRPDPTMWWKLDEDKNVVQFTGSWEELNQIFEIEHKRVKQEYVLDDKYWISTVFLGLSHSFGDVPGHFFETMVFKNEGNGGGDVYQDRYDTWDEAVAGHERVKSELIAGTLELYGNDDTKCDDSVDKSND